MSGIWLVAFAVFAVIDWIAVSNEQKRLEYVAKPAALAALLLYAANGAAASPWLIAALALSLLGDVYLMLPGDLVIAGLSAFLLAHLAYIGDMTATVGARVLWLVVILALSSPLSLRILRSVTDPRLRVAVCVYMLAIALMVGSAFASGEWLAVVGALLFFASDSLIAWNRFVVPLPWAPTAIIVTYHLGQWGLVTALRS
jgi:alkenylglycerophosphocholine/alkenylglycerophosphoethanolamine hydrolase